MRLRSGRCVSPKSDCEETSEVVEIRASRSSEYSSDRRVRHTTLAVEMWSYLGWSSSQTERTPMSNRERSAISAAIDRAAEAIRPNSQSSRERQAARRDAARLLNMEEQGPPVHKKFAFFRQKKVWIPAVISIAMLAGFCIGFSKLLSARLSLLRSIASSRLCSVSRRF